MLRRLLRLFGVRECGCGLLMGRSGCRACKAHAIREARVAAHNDHQRQPASYTPTTFGAYGRGGWMQPMPSTFEAYGRGSIFDPVANVEAAYRYITAQYGEDR